MSPHEPLPRRPHLPTALFVLVAVVCLLVTSSAMAGGGTVYWRMDVDETVDKSARRHLDDELKSVLSRAEDTHLLTDNALQRHLQDQPFKIPRCFEGSTPCTSLPEQLVEGLLLSGVVDVGFVTADDGYSLTLAYYREYGGTPKRVTKTGDNIEALVRDAVSEIFTLEAVIAVTSVPEGADLSLNGRKLGKTPFEVVASEGTHTILLEAEGYDPLRETVSLVPGEQKELALTMTAKLTQVTVITRAPDATVWIDGTMLGAAGEPVDTQPGHHDIELRAPGYRNISIGFDISPGERRTMHLAMLREVEDPWAIRERGIVRHRVFAEAQYNLMFQSGTFAGATADLNGAELNPSDYAGQTETSLLLNGVQVAIGYTTEYLGLVLIGAGILVGDFEDELGLADPTGAVRNAEGGSVLRIALYPLQGTARYLMGPFSIDGITGFGVGFDTFGATVGSDDIDLAETAFFWRLAASGRYWMSEKWYLGVGYQIELDFAEGRGIRHGVVASVGLNMPFLMADDGSEATEGIELDEDVPIEDVPAEETPSEDVPAEAAPEPGDMPPSGDILEPSEEAP